MQEMENLPSFIYELIFSKHFILIEVDPETVLETDGTRFVH